MPFQILSLSGGGYMGLYSISVLEKLEEHFKRPIYECFDLIAGTSIGGIIALGLAAECSAAEIRQSFERNGAKIFSDKPAKKSRIETALDIKKSWLKPKYDDLALKQTIIDLVGAEKTIGDLKHPVIIPAVNMTKGSSQVFKTPHHPTFKRDLFFKLVEVGLATSAAPTYFPLAEIGDELFADGGLYLNSPDLAALHEAEYFFGVPTQDISMLSIGTTTAKFSLSHTVGRDLGIWHWIQKERLLRTSLSSQQLCTDFMMKHKLDKRYLRLDEYQSREQEEDLALDVATIAAQKTIKGMAEATARREMSNPELTRMFAHKKRDAVFFNPNTELPR